MQVLQNLNRIEEQGSFFVGGQTLFTLTANDTSAVSSRNPGTSTINQSYVQFQIPASNKYKLPIILYHGGGHHGKAFESTPDGREGWATYFLRQGFAVYLVDGVNRGRSGYDMIDLALVRQGVEPITSIPQMNRYTYELAWTQFRIGPVLEFHSRQVNFLWRHSPNTPISLSLPGVTLLLRTPRI